MEVSEFTSLNYYHRDLSWLLFNRRVIHEANDPSNPLLEQLRFLAIASSNLDEFFMVRVPSIQSLARLQPKAKDARTGWTQEEVLFKLYEINLNNTRLQYQYFNQIIEDLAQHQQFVKSVDELTETQLQEVDRFFYELLLPAVTPIGLDAYHAFPKLAEKKVHIFVQVRQENRIERAVIPLPPLFSRLHQLADEQTYLLVEELITKHLPELFVGWEIDHSFCFRITYDKDLEFREDTDEKLFTQMEEYIVERSKGLPSRLEISGTWSKEIEESVLILADLLQLKARDLYWVPGPLDLTFLFPFVDTLAKEFPGLVFPRFTGNTYKEKGPQLFQAIEKNDLLFHHPYDSFEVVLNFLEAAAEDPNTIAIKQTLYRMAPHSRVVKALKKAAAKGKQVTVLVELKARFDEENNLHWVQELEEAGCYVSYGLHQLKTHSKALLVVKKEGRQVKQYAHFGTGNYNEKTSSIYTDISLFTAKKEYVEDITAFFNYLSGYREVPHYQKIAVSPNGIQHKLLEKIEDTMTHYQQTKQGSICFKMNSLTDKVVINKLYEASQVGVPIHLIVRGACCLKPGIPHLSEAIEVTSIVGRFLEHSRIYAFYTSEEDAEVWISSADIMTRNMLHRIEIATPVEKGPALDKLLTVLDAFKKDRKKAYLLTESGHFRRFTEDNSFSSQDYFMTNSQPQSEMILPFQTPDNPNLLSKIRKIWQSH